MFNRAAQVEIDSSRIMIKRRGRGGEKIGQPGYKFGWRVYKNTFRNRELLSGLTWSSAYIYGTAFIFQACVESRKKVG